MEFKSKEKMTKKDIEQWWKERPFAIKKQIYGEWLRINLENF